MSIESGEQSRNSDLCDEPVDRLLTPIRGYENRPIVPLTDTIQPISTFFNDIQDYTYVALHNSKNPSEGLDQQESAAIHLYTMQFHDGPSLFHLLNKSLRAEDREELKSWFSFLKLFLTALHKLPSQNQRLYRGVKNVNLSSKYKKGTEFAWWGVSSCTTDIEVLESNAFLGKHGLRTMFIIDCINGKSISNHSYFKKKEKEVILMPGSYFEVIGQLNPAPEFYIIEIKEIRPPIILIKPPIDKSSSEVKKSNTYPQTTTNSASKNEEFAIPGTFKELSCKGRHCAKCIKCRDWYYTGDASSWQWIRNVMNWKGNDWTRYNSDCVSERFKKRDGATCFFYGGVGYDGGHGIHACFCEDNMQNAF